MAKTLLSILVAFVLGLGVIGPAWAFRGDDTKTAFEPGGQGGTPIRDECPPGDWMVGLAAEAAKDLNQVAVLCQHFQGTKAAGNTYQLTVRGTHAEENGVDSAPRCDNGDVVTAMKVEVSHVATVHRIKLVCSTPSGTANYVTGWSRVSGGAGEQSFTAQCEVPNGQQSAAVGISGGGGDLIHSLGLYCAANGSPAALVKVKSTPAPTPPPAVKPPAPVKPPVAVDNSDDAGAIPAPGKHNTFARTRAAGGNGGADGVNNLAAPAGNGGGESSAADAATVYDKPDGNDVGYLNAGDAVTIVRCHGNNWCQISAPQPGWVWGDDLNR